MAIMAASYTCIKLHSQVLKQLLRKVENILFSWRKSCIIVVLNKKCKTFVVSRHDHGTCILRWFKPTCFIIFLQNSPSRSKHSTTPHFIFLSHVCYIKCKVYFLHDQRNDFARFNDIFKNLIVNKLLWKENGWKSFYFPRNKFTEIGKRESEFFQYYVRNIYYTLHTWLQRCLLVPKKPNTILAHLFFHSKCIGFSTKSAASCHHPTQFSECFCIDFSLLWMKYSIYRLVNYK